jgi:hypothetical protein
LASNAFGPTVPGTTVKRTLTVVAKSLPAATTVSGFLCREAEAATVADGASSLMTAVAASTMATTPNSSPTVRPRARAPAGSPALGTFT